LKVGLKLTKALLGGGRMETNYKKNNGTSKIRVY